MKNILSSLPEDLSAEVFEDIVSSESVRIERIVSKGHASPASGWYDQQENEWVIVLQGAARLLFESGREVGLNPGDFVNIPAHCKGELDGSRAAHHLAGGILSIAGLYPRPRLFWRNASVRSSAWPLPTQRLLRRERGV